MPLPPKAELQWWYQYYFATERGRAGYAKNTHDFAKLIWQLASPKWNFDDATFDRSAASLDNPDHVDIAIHNYRWRLAIAEGEPKYLELEKRLAEMPVITVPTITIEGRRQRSAASGSGLICREVLRQIFASAVRRRRRTQSAAGGPAAICRGYAGSGANVAATRPQSATNASSAEVPRGRVRRGRFPGAWQ